MKNNQPQSTPLQQVWLRRAVVLFIILGAAWLVFAPGNGLLTLYSQRQELQTLQAERDHLIEENNQLQAEIDKMKNDPAHLEEVARRNFGLLKPNERVYDFSKQSGEKGEE